MAREPLVIQENPGKSTEKYGKSKAKNRNFTKGWGKIPENQMGLDIDPKHVGINEYMGELYLSTNRPELAKERLAVLKDCNCEEYDELKALIEGKKESKY